MVEVSNRVSVKIIGEELGQVLRAGLISRGITLPPSMTIRPISKTETSFDERYATTVFQGLEITYEK